MKLKNMNAVKDALIVPTIPSQPINFGVFQELEQYYLLQGVLEGFIDGILILTEAGELLHANQTAKCICQQLTEPGYQQYSVPSEIWLVCQSLIDSREMFPNQRIILESEIAKGNSVNFRLRVRWFKLEQMQQDCLLVTIEDKYQSLQEMVSNDVHQYDLTPREAEVWLLYRANYAYKEIAQKLYITINTVKKHMKNIHAKRKATYGESEE